VGELQAGCDAELLFTSRRLTWINALPLPRLNIRHSPRMAMTVGSSGNPHPTAMQVPRWDPSPATVIGLLAAKESLVMEKKDYEASDYFAQQAHLAAHLCRTCTDKAVAATLGQLAREYAVKAIDFGASPEGFSDMLLAPGSSMDTLHHRTVH
jgi:hypothetical protein